MDFDDSEAIDAVMFNDLMGLDEPTFVPIIGEMNWIERPDINHTPEMAIKLAARLDRTQKVNKLQAGLNLANRALNYYEKNNPFKV